MALIDSLKNAYSSVNKFLNNPGKTIAPVVSNIAKQIPKTAVDLLTKPNPLNPITSGAAILKTAAPKNQQQANQTLSNLLPLGLKSAGYELLNKATAKPAAVTAINKSGVDLTQQTPLPMGAEEIALRRANLAAYNNANGGSSNMSTGMSIDELQKKLTEAQNAAATGSSSGQTDKQAASKAYWQAIDAAEEAEAANPTTSKTPAAGAGSYSSTQTSDQLKALQEAYIASMAQTPEEQQTQQQIDNINQRIADLSESEQAGILGTAQKDIPMEFITGEQKAIEERGNQGIKTLQDQLALLQAKQTALSEKRGLATKQAEARLGFAQPTASDIELKDVNGALYRVNKTTGQTELLAGTPGGTTPTVKDINGVSSIWNPTTGQFEPIKNITAPVNQETLYKTQNALSVADELLTSSSLGAAVGPVSSQTPIIRGATADFVAKFKQLQSLLTMENLGLMKGTLSDNDIKMLQSAATALNLGMSEQGFVNELNKIKTVLNARLQTPAYLEAGSMSGSTNSEFSW